MRATVRKAGVHGHKRTRTQREAPAAHTRVGHDESGATTHSPASTCVSWALFCAFGTIILHRAWKICSRGFANLSKQCLCSCDEGGGSKHVSSPSLGAWRELQPVTLLEGCLDRVALKHVAKALENGVGSLQDAIDDL